MQIRDTIPVEAYYARVQPHTVPDQRAKLVTIAEDYQWTVSLLRNNTLEEMLLQCRWPLRSGKACEMALETNFDYSLHLLAHYLQVPIEQKGLSHRKSVSKTHLLQSLSIKRSSIRRNALSASPPTTNCRLCRAIDAWRTDDTIGRDFSVEMNRKRKFPLSFRLVENCFREQFTLFLKLLSFLTENSL